MKKQSMQDEGPTEASGAEERAEEEGGAEDEAAEATAGGGATYNDGTFLRMTLARGAAAAASCHITKSRQPVMRPRWRIDEQPTKGKLQKSDWAGRPV